MGFPREQKYIYIYFFLRHALFIKKMLKVEYKKGRKKRKKKRLKQLSPSCSLFRICVQISFTLECGKGGDLRKIYIEKSFPVLRKPGKKNANSFTRFIIILRELFVYFFLRFFLNPFYVCEGSRKGGIFRLLSC